MKKRIVLGLEALLLALISVVFGLAMVFFGGNFYLAFIAGFIALVGTHFFYDEHPHRRVEPNNRPARR